MSSPRGDSTWTTKVQTVSQLSIGEKGTRVVKMEAKYGLLVLTFYVAIFTGAKCDIYTSIQKITALAEMEDKLFKEFEVFLQKSDTKGEIVPDTVIR